jgi:hypothetical protein
MNRILPLRWFDTEVYNNACVNRSSLKMRRQSAVQQHGPVTTASGRTYMAR